MHSQWSQVPLVSLIGFFDWICERCCACHTNDQTVTEALQSDKLFTNPIIARRSQLLEAMLTALKTDGVIFTKDIMTEFRAILNELNVYVVNHSRLCNSLSKHISALTRHHYASFKPINIGDKYGKIIYDREKFTSHSLNYIFKLKIEEWKGNQSLRKLIKNQMARFPKSSNFDYTQLLSSEGTMSLDSYFDPELVCIIDEITTHSNMHDYIKILEHVGLR